MSERDKNWAWGQHWKNGALSSLNRENVKGPYPESQAGWNRFFSTLPKEAVVLDICTGNGFVPVLANQFSTEMGKNFTIVGIDQAPIDPITRVKTQRNFLKDITFLGGVRAESLPFSDDFFDAVTGQYALEYTDITRAGAELGRVLKSGGKARFVIHASEGKIVLKNTPQIKLYEFILAKSGFLLGLCEAVRFAFEYEKSGEATIKSQFLKARHRLKEKAIYIRAEILKTSNPQNSLQLVDDLVKAYIMRSQFNGWTNFEIWLIGVRIQAEIQLNMLRALSEAARSQIEITEIKNLLEFNGLRAGVIGEVRIKGNHLHGWTLECFKI